MTNPSDADRIRLAEAMGWTEIRMKYVEMDECSYPFGCPPADQYANNMVDKRFKEQIPDPYTDANDDYAVLLWMHTQRSLFDALFWLEFNKVVRSDYAVGDYARAALRVIE